MARDTGEHELMCRAADANGDAQPIEQRFDRGGLAATTPRAAWSARPVGRHGLEIAPH
jgi:hypothetical protein